MGSEGGYKAGSQRILKAAVMFAAFCLVFALSYVHLDGYSSPLMVPDEFGYITPAAFLAGHDWSGVTQGLPWYSFGYSLVLLPVFLILEPEGWYRGAQFVNALLLLAVAPMLVATVRRSGVQVKSAFLPWAAALLVLLYPSVFFYSRLAVSETLILAMTLVAVLLINRVISRGLRWFDVLILGAFCASLYFVHSRLISTVAAAFLVVVVATYFRSSAKAAIGVAGLFVAGMVPVLLAGQQLKSRFISDLYGGQLYGAQHSLAESIGARLRNIGSMDGLVSLLSVGAGQTTYLLVSTFGIAALGVFWSIRRAAAWRPGHPDPQARDSAVPVFLLLNLALALLVSVLALSTPAYPHHVFYGRYTEPAMLPLFALGIAAIASGEVRWRWLLYSATVVFALLAPAAMKLATSLPAENTYWILIAGLFAFREGDWAIGYPLMFGGFVSSVVITWLCFRAGRWVGVGVVAALFAMASVDLARSHSGAGAARQASFSAVTEAARSGRAPIVYAFDEDDLFMRTEVQLLNPRARVVLSENAARKSGSAGYEVITKSGKEVTHAWCSGGGNELSDCSEVAATRRKFELKAGWPGDATITAMQASAMDLLLRRAGDLPFVRSLDLANLEVVLAVRARMVAGGARGVSLVTFVTHEGQPGKWLNDVREKIAVPADGGWVEQQARASLLAYDGTPLPPGYYDINVVLQNPERYMWGTRISVRLKVEPAK